MNKLIEMIDNSKHIECFLIREYKFNNKQYGVIQFDANKLHSEDKLIFTIDVLIENHPEIISKHVSVSNGKSIPELILLDKSDIKFLLTKIQHIFAQKGHYQ